MNDYAKTALQCYNCIDACTKRIDAALYKYAVKSHCLGNYPSGGTAMQLLCRVAALVEDKRLLLELKGAIRQSLMNMHKPYRALLVMRYVRRNTHEHILAFTRLPQTTLYRYYNYALSEFASLMAAQGCTKQWFYDNFLRFKWIKRLHDTSKSKPSCANKSDVKQPL